MLKLRLVISACAVAACLTSLVGCNSMLFQPHRWHELNSGPALGSGSNFSVPDDFESPQPLEVPLPQ